MKKNAIKSFKALAGAFVLGEVIALFYKDENFREKFSKAEGVDKAKTVISSLIDLNKKIFLDIKNIDYKEKAEEFKERFHTEKERIEEKIEYVRKNIDKLNEEKITPLITEIEERYQDLKEQAEKKGKELNEKYELEAKAEKLKNKISQIKEKMNENKEK